jgi:Flp pilus assembly protein protease CpaA
VIPLTAWDPVSQPLQWGVVIGASLVAALTDWTARRIPNWLTLSVFVGGVAWSAWAGGATGFWNALAGCGVMMLPTLLLFIFAGGGAGDAKLMGALGSWLGVGAGLVTLAAVSAASVVLAVAFSLAHRRLLVVVSNTGQIVRRLATAWLFGLASVNDQPVAEESKVQAMPYGIAICAGVLASAVGALLWRGS